MRTSENVNFPTMLGFFLLTRSRADTTSLHPAKGRMMNEIKKEGIVVAMAKLSTTSTRGSAKKDETRIPRSSFNIVLQITHLRFPMTCIFP